MMNIKMMRNVDIMTDSINETKKRYLKTRQSYKELEENPDIIYKYFDNHPYFFSTLWKLYSCESENRDLNKVLCVFTFKMDIENNYLDYFSFTYMNFFFNYNSYSDDKNSEMQDNMFEMSEIFKSEFISLAQSFYDCQYSCDVLGDGEVSDEIETERFYVTPEFAVHFIIPIIEGKYSEYLERLAKKSLLNLNLKGVE